MLPAIHGDEGPRPRGTQRLTVWRYERARQREIAIGDQAASVQLQEMLCRRRKADCLDLPWLQGTNTLGRQPDRPIVVDNLDARFIAHRQQEAWQRGVPCCR